MDTDFIEKNLNELFYSDSLHDFHSTMVKSDIIKNANLNLPMGASKKPDNGNIINEDNFLGSLLGNDNIKNRYTTAVIELEKGKSIRQYLLEKLPSKSIFFICDVAKAVHKNLAATKNTGGSTIPYYWMQTRSTMFDPAGKITPKTQKELFDENFKFCQEDFSPGRNQNLMFPEWNTDEYNKSKLVEYTYFSNKTIYMIGVKDEAKILVSGKDNNKNVYFYADKSLSQKGGSSIQNYTSIFTSIQKIFSGAFSDIFTKATKGFAQKKFDTASLLLAKRLGDAGQFIQATTPNIPYFTETNKQGQTSEGHHAFVSFDRLAVAGALLIGCPIVIYEKGDAKTAHIYILNELSTLKVAIESLDAIKKDYNNITQKNKALDIGNISNIEIDREMAILNKEYSKEKTRDADLKIFIKIHLIYLPLFDLFTNYKNALFNYNKNVDIGFDNKIEKIEKITKEERKNAINSLIIEMKGAMNDITTSRERVDDLKKRITEIKNKLASLDIDYKNIDAFLGKNAKEDIGKIKPFEFFSSLARRSGRSNLAEAVHIELFGLNYLSTIKKTLENLQKYGTNGLRFTETINGILNNALPSLINNDDNQQYKLDILRSAINHFNENPSISTSTKKVGGAEVPILDKLSISIGNQIKYIDANIRSNEKTPTYKDECLLQGFLLIFIEKYYIFEYINSVQNELLKNITENFERLFSDDKIIEKYLYFDGPVTPIAPNTRGAYGTPMSVSGGGGKRSRSSPSYGSNREPNSSSAKSKRQKTTFEIEYISYQYIYDTINYNERNRGIFELLCEVENSIEYSGYMEAKPLKTPSKIDNRVRREPQIDPQEKAVIYNPSYENGTKKPRFGGCQYKKNTKRKNRHTKVRNEIRRNTRRNNN